MMSMWVGNVDVKHYQSLSVDWSGGGIVTTTRDQIDFMKALYAGELVKLETLRRMEAVRGHFMKGIAYGLGLMTFEFEGFFFMLKGLPRMRGHIGGVNSSLMLYDMDNDLYYVGSFGKLGTVPAHVKWLIQIVSGFSKVKVQS